MSKERARARAERERQAAIVAAARAAEAERRERRDARRRALTRWLPTPRRRPTPGLLAAKRRRQIATTVLVLVLINVLIAAFTVTWAPRILALAVSMLTAPVLYTMMFRKH